MGILNIPACCVKETSNLPPKTQSVLFDFWGDATIIQLRGSEHLLCEDKHQSSRREAGRKIRKGSKFGQKIFSDRSLCRVRWWKK